MKRLLVALVVGGMLFAGAWAAACALNVDAGVLQAGSDEVLTCDCDGVQVYFRSDDTPGIQWDPSEQDFIVDHVVVGGLDDDCLGLVMRIVLTDKDGNGIAFGEMDPIVTADTNPIVPIEPAVPASEVCDVHVLIQD
jgi:hypothetical protein